MQDCQAHHALPLQEMGLSSGMYFLNGLQLTSDQEMIVARIQSFEYCRLFWEPTYTDDQISGISKAQCYRL